MAKDISSSTKKTAVTDPLEAAKIMSRPIAPPPPEPEERPMLAEPSGEVEPPREPPKKYRVVEDAKIWLHGQPITLHKGTVISESSYGPLAMKTLLSHDKLTLVEHKE